MSDDPREADRASNFEITNILHPGGEIKGPVAFQIDDSVEETIEDLVTEYNLPGNAEDYRLYVTDANNQVIMLEGSYPIEDYVNLLQAYIRIELTDGDPQPPPPLGVVPKNGTAKF